MRSELFFRLSVLMKDDDRVIQLVTRRGMEGFGIYISLLMELRKRDGYKCAVHTLDYLARQWNVSCSILYEVVSAYGLFELDETAGGEGTFSSLSLCESMAGFEDWLEGKKKKRQAKKESEALGTAAGNPPTTVQKPDGSVQNPLEAVSASKTATVGVTVKRAPNGRFTVKPKSAPINTITKLTTTSKEKEKPSAGRKPEIGAGAATLLLSNRVEGAAVAESAATDPVVASPVAGKPWTVYLDEAFNDRIWVEIQAMQSGLGLAFMEHLPAVKELFRTHVIAQGAEKNLYNSADVRSYFSNFNRVGMPTHRRIADLLKRASKPSRENDRYRFEQRDPVTGVRSYCGRSLPADAPPRPSENAVWSDELKQWA